MATRRHTEPLHGGLVTARDPGTLALGELSALANSVYAPGSLALRRATGRTSYGTLIASSTAPVVGLRDAKFDNSDHFLIGLASNIFASSSLAVASATAGTFTSFAYLVASNATALDALHYEDEWFMFTGVGASASASSNVSFYVSATSSGQALRARAHGLLPVTTAPAATTATGTWTAGSTGFFEYWTTEVFEYTKNGATAQLESTFVGTPLTLSVTSTGMQANIFPPATRVNAQATKYRLYRAGPKELATDTLFPVGFRVGSDFEFATTSAFTDGGAVQGAFASANATAAGLLTQWATPLAATGAGDAAWATHTGSTPGDLVLGFDTFTVNEPILGLELGITGKKDGSGIVGVSVSVSNDGGVTYSASRTVALSSTNQELTFIGAVNDLWGLNWSTAGVSSSKFRVRFYGVVVGSGTAHIDSVRARFTHGGSNTGDSEEPFPAIIIEIDGADASVGSHGPAPIATTGDIHQGHLVTNDVSAPSLTRHSLPGQPDYFPSIYFIDYETPDNDRVTNIKTLNNKLGVFLSSRLYRVNYLPTEADAHFSRGICKEEISPELGCVNAMCACTYTGPIGRTEIAFVSNNGIHSTDLFSVHDLSNALDWRSIVATANSTPIALVNDPEKSELLFYYYNEALAPESYRCLHLSYDSIHVSRSAHNLKLSGQVNMRNYDTATEETAELYSVWSVTRSTGASQVFLGYGAAGGNLSIPAVTPTSDVAGTFYLQSEGLNQFRWIISDLQGGLTTAAACLATAELDDTNFIFINNYNNNLLPASGTVNTPELDPAYTQWRITLDAKLTSGSYTGGATFQMQLTLGDGNIYETAEFTVSETPTPTAWTTLTFDIDTADGSLGTGTANRLHFMFDVPGLEDFPPGFYIDRARIEPIITGAGAGAGAIYLERGSTIPAQEPRMSFTTRRLFPGGYGNEVRVNELYTYMNAASTSGAQSFTLTPSTVKTNDPSGLVARSARTRAWSGEALWKVQNQIDAEGVQIAFSQSATASANFDTAIEHFTFTLEGQGIEDSGI